MKAIRLGLVVMAAALITFGLGGTALAFHDGGVAECSGCHSMHSPNALGTSLLTGQDQSSTCLNCHTATLSFQVGQSYHISTTDTLMPAGTAPGNLTPGGDFGWLKKTYSWTPPWTGATPETEEGETHGHNIVAGDFGFIADTTTTSPGGTYPAGSLGCTSCHDPHGKYRRLANDTIVLPTPTGTSAVTIGSGSYESSPVPGTGEAVGAYRLLAGNNYQTDGVTFTGNPSAVAPDTYNRSESVTQTRVAYGHVGATGNQAWGNWCATCHGSMHSSSGYVHPTDQNLTGITTLATYNAYVKSGDLSGSAASSYLSLVPFTEVSTSNYASLATHAKSDDTYLNGPLSGAQVSCLSCHRAHASGFEYMMRWNPESEFLTVGGVWPGTDTTPTEPQFARGRTSAEMEKAYYDRPASTFASYQRSLCNKCHGKD
jgi:hypothetical protein